ncbi:MAG: glycosyltransferase family 2 protein [Tepidisphaeraceae bacterium]
MKLPRITLVTPSYNHAQYIGMTVRSVVLQRYPDLEYILMDGGSSDGTMDVLAPYMDHFAYAVSEKDKGQSDAICRGFEKSTGEIMGYLNSDDVLAPGALQAVADFFLAHREVDALYSHRCAIDAPGRVVWYWILPQHSDYLMMRWDLIPQETCFWRRRIFEKAGNVDPSYRFAMDYDLFVRYMSNGGRFARINRFLGAFRQHDQSKTSTLLATIGQEEVRKVWAKYNLHNHFGDHIRSTRFMHGAMRNGSAYAQSGRQLPGALSGVGYDYDDVWGGMLKDPRIPPRVAGTTMLV